MDRIVPGVGHPVKVALVHPKFDGGGGAELYAERLARGLALRGHEVHLFARKGRLPKGCAAFHRVPAATLGRALKTYSFWRLCGRMVRPERFDVVHGFGKTTCQTVHRAGGGVHRAFLERGGAAKRTVYDRVVLRIEDALFASERLRAVICPSRWVAREVERFYPSAADRLRVIPNGVDTERFRPEGRGNDRAALRAELGGEGQGPVLLFVATNFRLKGLDRAIAALARVPGARVAVVGGDDPVPHRELARSAGVAERVRFLGARTGLAPLYRGADLLIHPTRYDPFANVCLEALACGTPVATTEANGAADILADGRGGRIVSDPDEPAGWAEAVAGLLDRPGAGRERARAVAVENSQTAHVAAVEALYEGLLESSRDHQPNPRGATP